MAASNWTKSLAFLLLLTGAVLSALPIAAAQTFREFVIPQGGGPKVGPNSITTGPDGALWFTNTFYNTIGRLSLDGVTSQLSEFPVPTFNASPLQITTGSDGALWFTMFEGGKIGRITIDGKVTEYATPTQYSRPYGIAPGPDGALWFTEQHANKIGKITTAGVITEYAIPTGSSAPRGIAAGSDGALWFTEWSGQKIGKITTSGTVTEYLTPSIYPNNITAGPDGALWFTVQGGQAQIGKITTGGTITYYPTSSSSPFDITTGPDGALWFTVQDGNAIFRITTAGAITNFPTPQDSGAFNLTFAYGTLWFTSSMKLGTVLWSQANPEGDVAHGADTARAAPYNATGTGIKVCVISSDVRYLAASQVKGFLPAVSILNLNGVPQTGVLTAPVGTGEGTAMLEIIHRIAPDAELMFATGWFPANPELLLATNIEALGNAGCKIIVDDITTRTGSPFQDGNAAQAVNAVSAKGILYVTSTGNYGNWRPITTAPVSGLPSVSTSTSQVWEGDFVDSGISVTLPNGKKGNFHAFEQIGTNYKIYNILLPTDGQDRRTFRACPFKPDGTAGGIVNLFWNDPLGKSSNDYDLVIMSFPDEVFRYASVGVQNGSQDPYEGLPIYPGHAVGIVKKDGAADRYLRLEVQPSGICRLQYSTSGSVRGHNAAVTAVSVGAVSALGRTTPFTGGTAVTVSPYSSDGDRRMYFKPNGDLYKVSGPSNNYTQTGGELMAKPDVAAAGEVSTSVPGYQPFHGTSAAAPQVAGMAALVWSYRPNLRAGQIKGALINSALDIETPGWDTLSGAGIAMAVPALQLAASWNLWQIKEGTCFDWEGTWTFTDGWSGKVNLRHVGGSCSPGSGAIKTADFRVTVNGDSFSAVIGGASDNNNCTYSGLINNDRVKGVYFCSQTGGNNYDFEIVR